jgi:hypothetical protein
MVFPAQSQRQKAGSNELILLGNSKHNQLLPNLLALKPGAERMSMCEVGITQAAVLALLASTSCENRSQNEFAAGDTPYRIGKDTLELIATRPRNTRQRISGRPGTVRRIG